MKAADPHSLPQGVSSGDLLSQRAASTCPDVPPGAVQPRGLGAEDLIHLLQE